MPAAGHLVLGAVGFPGADPPVRVRPGGPGRGKMDRAGGGKAARRCGVAELDLRLGEAIRYPTEFQFDVEEAEVGVRVDEDDAARAPAWQQFVLEAVTRDVAGAVEVVGYGDRVVEAGP